MGSVYYALVRIPKPGKNAGFWERGEQVEGADKWPNVDKWVRTRKLGLEPVDVKPKAKRAVGAKTPAPSAPPADQKVDEAQADGACEHCGKRHQTPETAAKCAAKHATTAADQS